MTNSEIKTLLKVLPVNANLELELMNFDLDEEALVISKASSDDFFVGFKSDGSSRHYSFDYAVIAIANELK